MEPQSPSRPLPGTAGSPFEGKGPAAACLKEVSAASLAGNGRLLDGHDCFLFDFDYTLADSSDGIVESFRRACLSTGSRVPPESAIRATIGEPLEAAYQRLLGPHARRYAAFREEFLRASSEVMVERSLILPGVPSAVSALHRCGKVLGIVSSKDRGTIGRILERGRLEEAFDFVVGEEDVAHPKPHPDGLELGLALSGCARERAVYFGDHPCDALFARNAGIDFVPVLSGVFGEGDFPKALSGAGDDGMWERGTKSAFC